MIKALLFAGGTFITLCGGLLLVVDQVVLTEYAGHQLRKSLGARADSETRVASAHVGQRPWQLVSLGPQIPGETTAAAAASRGGIIDPPDWAAFALLSVGGVTLLYMFVLPARPDDDEDEEYSCK